jgi:hypothetical protein
VGQSVGTAVIGLGEDNRAFVAKLFNQNMIARRKIDIVARVAAAGGGSGPSETGLSKSQRQVTERSPRMLSVASALSWPALGMPTTMPNCCNTAGSEAVVSILPNSMGRP